MMKILTLLNEKGGVGKTTLAVHIAVGLAMRGYRALLVDADAQANATASLGLEEDDGLFRLLVDDAEWRETLRRPDAARLAVAGSLDGALFILPGSVKTRVIPLLQDDVAILHSRLAELKHYIDVAVIDTAPTPSMLHSMIYVASDAMLYPTQCEHLSLAGLAKSVAHMRRIQQTRRLVAGRETALLGVVPVMVRARTLTHHHGLGLLKDKFGDRVCQPLPQRTIWTQASFAQQTIYAFAPGHSAEREMQRLTHRVALVLFTDEPKKGAEQ